MQIQKVTITGADDSTDLSWLESTSRRYPFVEWGILVSESQQGMHRFPSPAWMNQLAELSKTHRLQLSLHVCGKWVRSICAGDWSPLLSNITSVSNFQRVQLNFHAYEHLLTESFFGAARRQTEQTESQLIFQIDGVNDHLVSMAYDAGIDAVPLYDLSGGAGIVPKEWPKQLAGITTGFAGGLGPENILKELDRIKQSTTGDGVIWVDMETRVRVKDDSRLDVSAVNDVLAKVEMSGFLAHTVVG